MHAQLLIKLSSGKNFTIPCSQWNALGAQVPGSRQGLMFLTACESLYYNQFDVMHSAIANFLFIICSLHLRPVTLERTIINSTGPHKPMNIIRDSLLAK